MPPQLLKLGGCGALQQTCIVELARLFRRAMVCPHELLHVLMKCNAASTVSAGCRRHSQVKLSKIKELLPLKMQSYQSVLHTVDNRYCFSLVPCGVYRCILGRMQDVTDEDKSQMFLHDADAQNKKALHPSASLRT